MISITNLFWAGIVIANKVSSFGDWWEGLLPGNECLKHLGKQQGRSPDFVEVAIYEDEVRIVTGDEFAFVLLCEFSIGRALRVSVESLAAGELVFREIALVPASFMRVTAA